MQTRDREGKAWQAADETDATCESRSGLAAQPPTRGNSATYAWQSGNVGIFRTYRA